MKSRDKEMGRRMENRGKIKFRIATLKGEMKVQQRRNTGDKRGRRKQEWREGK